MSLPISMLKLPGVSTGAGGGSAVQRFSIGSGTVDSEHSTAVWADVRAMMVASTVKG